MQQHKLPSNYILLFLNVHTFIFILTYLYIYFTGLRLNIDTVLFVGNVQKNFVLQQLQIIPKRNQTSLKIVKTVLRWWSGNRTIKTTKNKL